MIFKLDFLPVEIWSMSVSYLSLIEIFDLSCCSKFFIRVRDLNESFKRRKPFSNHLLNFNKQYFSFITEVFDEYFIGLKKAVESCIKPHVFLSVRCCINDLVYEMSPLRVYCHLFHSKRGFNVVNRCQYRRRFFVDDVSLSSHMEKMLSFSKADFKDELSNILYETFLLNVHHTDVIKSVKTDTLLNSNTNFGELFHDSVTNIF